MLPVVALPLFAVIVPFVFATSVFVVRSVSLLSRSLVLPLPPLDALPGRDAGFDAVLVVRIHRPELGKGRLPAWGWVQCANMMAQFALDTEHKDRRAADNPVLVDAK